MSVPSPARRRIVTLLAIIPWAILLFQFLVVLPRYGKIFKEFGLKLPRLVEIIFAASAWVRGHMLLSFLITFVLMGTSIGAVHVVHTTPVSRSRRLLVLFLVFGIPCLFFLASWVGVSWTQRKLAEGFDR